MALQFELIPWGTRVESNGEGEKVDISASQTRTFLSTLEIADQMEQESIDVSIWISEDGENWSTKPILKLPQQLYRGETRAVRDLAVRPGVTFSRANGDRSRWGGVGPP